MPIQVRSFVRAVKSKPGTRKVVLPLERRDRTIEKKARRRERPDCEIEVPKATEGGTKVFNYGKGNISSRTKESRERTMSNDFCVQLPLYFSKIVHGGNHRP